MILPMDSNGIIKEGIITVAKGRITHVGRKDATTRFEATKIIDGRGKIALPGLINCHTHLSMTLFRGIAEDQPLQTWLRETIWPLEAKLQPEDIYVGALLGCLEMVKTGTTTFADMYFHEDKVAKAVEEAGLRAVLSQAVIETGNKDVDKRIFRDSVDFVKRFKTRTDERVIPRLGPHAVYSCSPELLKEVRQIAVELNVGIHIHLAESIELARQIKTEHDLSEVQILESLGFLDSDVLAAHCIHLSDQEMATLAKHGVKISYNPVANMKLAQGTPRIHDLLEAGLTVGFGTDGPASNNNLDLLQTAKIGALLQKQHYHDPTVLPASTVLRMATIDGARALGLEESIGSLEVGKKADIILVNLEEPHLTPIHDPYANIVYSASGSDVDTVIINGEVVMENREVKTLDEAEILEKAEKTAQDLLPR
jgi:5-methylthioadenosine/S-adenosylhomocysteine deaminase